MNIGCPKEIKVHEYRVGLVPAGVRELATHGHEVMVETNAGAGIGISDEAYRAAGASVLPDAKSVFARADMVVKVKEPLLPECAQLRRGQILFTYLHLAADAEQAKALAKSGVTAIAYETVTAPDRSLPLLTPMSEVAGRMSIRSVQPRCRKQTEASAYCSAAYRASRPRVSSSWAAASREPMRPRWQ